MAKLHIWHGDIDVTCPSEMYHVTQGSMSIDDFKRGRRSLSLGDGGYYTFSEAEIKWIEENKDAEDITMETFDDPVLQNISLMTPAGNRLLLPNDVVFDNYNHVKKTLTQCLGTYKNNGFTFPIDANIIQRKILSGEIKNLKKELQFFGTPDEVCTQVIDQLIGMLGPGYRALEPSAGQGALVKELMERRPEMEIIALEYSEINCAVFRNELPDIELHHGDFLEMTPEDIGGRFDLIVANPPFSKGQDVQHIMHMWKFLKPGGQLIAMSSPAIKTNNQKKYKDFREFMDFHCACSYPVQAGAFKSSGTNIETYINVIHKPWDEDETEAKREVPEEIQEEKKPEGGGQMSLF